MHRSYIKAAIYWNQYLIMHIYMAKQILCIVDSFHFVFVLTGALHSTKGVQHQSKYGIETSTEQITSPSSNDYRTANTQYIFYLNAKLL